MRPDARISNPTALTQRAWVRIVNRDVRHNQQPACGSADASNGSVYIPSALLSVIPGLKRTYSEILCGGFRSRSQSDDWAVGIPGFTSGFSKDLLVLIDGRSVYKPLFEGVYWDVQDVPLQDIDRIEVIRGPAGAVWGENAVNGVINIITKHARDTHGTYASALGGGRGENCWFEQRIWIAVQRQAGCRKYVDGAQLFA